MPRKGVGINALLPDPCAEISIEDLRGDQRREDPAIRDPSDNSKIGRPFVEFESFQKTSQTIGMHGQEVIALNNRPQPTEGCGQQTFSRCCALL